jgi:hypothetical protein
MYSQLYVKREAANKYFIFVSQLESSLPSQKTAEINGDEIPVITAWSILEAVGTKALTCISVTVLS